MFLYSNEVIGPMVRWYMFLYSNEVIGPNASVVHFTVESETVTQAEFWSRLEESSYIDYVGEANIEANTEGILVMVLCTVHTIRCQSIEPELTECLNWLHGNPSTARSSEYLAWSMFN